MDHNEFFRLVTLCICGNLEIEKAMSNCIGAVRDFLPVDRMFLQIYEPNLGAMRTMASATAEKGEKLDLLTPLPKEAREQVRRRLSGPVGDVVVIDSADRNPVAREMLRFHGIEGWSVIRITLSILISLNPLPAAMYKWQ